MGADHAVLRLPMSPEHEAMTKYIYRRRPTILEVASRRRGFVRLASERAWEWWTDCDGGTISDNEILVLPDEIRSVVPMQETELLPSPVVECVYQCTEIARPDLKGEAIDKINADMDAAYREDRAVRQIDIATVASELRAAIRAMRPRGMTDAEQRAEISRCIMRDKEAQPSAVEDAPEVDGVGVRIHCQDQYDPDE